MSFIDHAVNWYFETDPPHRLFYYTDYSGAPGILRRRELWAINFDDLDDRTELGRIDVSSALPLAISHFVNWNPLAMIRTWFRVERSP